MVDLETSRVRTTDQRLAIFRACFSGLPNAYGTYDPQTGRVWQVKRAVTDRVLLDHIEGRRPYGVYLLVGDRIRALAIDFDEDDLGPPMEFVRSAAHYGVTSYLEKSKSKGHHAWVYFEQQEGVLAARARLVVRHILAEIGHPHVEVFPKQDALRGDDFYGNFINVPLFAPLVRQGRTVFLDPSNPSQPHPDQWGLLEHVHRVSARLLDEIIEINGLVRTGPSAIPTHAPLASEYRRTFGLMPCAIRMLEEGVTANQRVACFRLAVQLKRTGLPRDMTLVVLTAWARKNRPLEGRRVITDEEVAEQVDSAYRADYAGFGCETEAIAPYCDPGCPLKTRAPSPAARMCDRSRPRSSSSAPPDSDNANGVRPPYMGKH
ncbi:MAG: hypothetical protein QUV05_20065 [Phycisphaerae bacterium]|nr:hypothetical protein [Phycisphaerae bacterium]